MVAHGDGYRSFWLVVVDRYGWSVFASIELNEWIDSFFVASFRMYKHELVVDFDASARCWGSTQWLER